MKKNKVINILILIFVFIILMETNSWAGKLNDCLYENGNNHILKKDYYKSKDSLYSVLNEEITDHLKNDAEEDAIRTDEGWVIDDNSYYYYFWFHGIKDMTDYIQSSGVSYDKIGDQDSLEDIYASIQMLNYTKGALGSFVIDNANKLPRAGIFSSDRAIQEFYRSGTAYGLITETYKKYQVPDKDGKVVDEFEIKVNQCIAELKAAYDYTANKPEFGDTVYIKDSIEKKKNYSESEIKKYIITYGNRNIPDEVEKIWEDKVGATIDEIQKGYIDLGSTGKIDAEQAEKLSERSEENKKDKDTVFLQPIGSGNNANGVEDAINDAETFVTTGDTGDKEIISKGNLQEFSQNLYSILLSIGVVVAVLIGAILGVKLMLAPIGERAEAKKLLIPYVVGCVIVFGAFGIWKLVVTIMQGL